MDAQCWQDHAVNVTLDSMEGALNWIWDLNKIVPHSATATVEGIIKALADQNVSIMILTNTSWYLQGCAVRKIEGRPVP